MPVIFPPSAGVRAYLLGDMEDFWSLSDLIELSKGPLSSLSQWLVDLEKDSAALGVTQPAQQQAQ